MSDEPFDKEEFVAYFRDEAEELLQQIDGDLLRLEEFVDSGQADPEIVNSLFRALHTIKGSSGMLGFTEVQGLAHKLENLCDLLRKERMPLSEGSVEILFSGRDFLTDLVQAAIGQSASPSGLIEFTGRLDQFVAIYNETSNVIEGRAPDRGDGGNSAGSEPMNEAEIAAFEAEVERLLAEAATTSPPAPTLPTTPVESVLATPRATAVTAAPARGSAENADAKKGAPQGKRSSLAQTIRVDIDRLDALLNLVGELVINRTRISDIATTLGRLMGDRALKASIGLIGPLSKDLADSAALLARTTNEIQESIMKVRMVPIGQVFDRFPRTVRDVAKARGKEVQLQISGADTDLDKTIVDEVGEPLMHLLRNCVDHGIEAPDERERQGKPRMGTIALNAYHEGNQIIIEISDDGGGINLDKVRAKAIKNGLIGTEDRLTDRELIELIFTPGFSTAEEVSDVSGRGVGMDVVKRNITKLKGIFDVDSAPGQGTRFTIKLPLTLAIIQALLVRVVDELYAIPLDSVIESQRVEMPDVRTVHGAEVITLRGQVVPLLRIADFFELGGERDPEKVMIVIVGLQGRQVGLVVDSFEGEQEIVIKPLSDVVGRIPGISGATILGNGSISLIIDVHSLVSDAYAGGKVTRAEFSGV
ncbi:MAG: chemotaxis protein CheA [Candidatus Eremiobacteraeota bacterium]|nr:chemotaxis protein CheA [Candidatus Eremiobacteraeota bacterium]NNM92868.1 chemotaxis protein CheA [Candidatus Eremiobacteraeota bacterium]